MTQYSFSFDGTEWKDNEKGVEWQCSRCKARFAWKDEAVMHVCLEHGSGTVYPRINAMGMKAFVQWGRVCGLSEDKLVGISEPTVLSMMGIKSENVLPENNEPAPGRDGMSDKDRLDDSELASLRRQLAEEMENLWLIQERKSEYVLETDIPLDLIKQERRKQECIEDLKQRIEKLERSQQRVEESMPEATGEALSTFQSTPPERLLKSDLAGSVPAHQQTKDTSKRVQNTVHEQQHQSDLDNYFDLMGTLLREGLQKSKEMNGIRDLARARTIIVLKNLGKDTKRKEIVIEFLYNSRLIKGSLSVIALSQADLKGINLSKESLARINLAGANLAGARLIGADLTQADLSGAILSDANIEGAKLAKADLKRAVLCGADLTQADLSQADLSNADMRHANLWAAELWGAKLDGTKLEGANLESIEIAGKVMAGTGDVEKYMTILDESQIYRFEVVGNSMEHEGVYEGDFVIVKASSEMPVEGDTIVAEYLPADKEEEEKKTASDVHIIGPMPDIGDELSGPTVKIFHEKVGDDKFYLLGWKKSVRGHTPILIKHMNSIGRVLTIYSTSSKRLERKWNFRV